MEETSQSQTYEMSESGENVHQVRDYVMRESRNHRMIKSGRYLQKSSGYSENAEREEMVGTWRHTEDIKISAKKRNGDAHQLHVPKLRKNENTTTMSRQRGKTLTCPKIID